MSYNFEQTTLGSIADILMGQSPPGETCNQKGLGIPLLNGPSEFDSYHPTPIQFTTDSRKLAKKNDLLFCVRGSTTGRMNWADQDYSIGRGLAALRHKRGIEYQPYLRALLETLLPDLLSSATGSTFPNVSRDQLLGAKVNIHPVDQQLAISRLLSSLDDKIVLNRQMCKTLEDIASALFKSWFIDFDPVKAKAAGREPEGLSPEIAALFPDSFVDTSLGKIPKGWKTSPFLEVVELNPKRTLKNGAEATYLDMSNMPTQLSRVNGWIKKVFTSGARFVNGDTLIARITPCLENGKTCYVDFLKQNEIGWGSTEYLIFRPKLFLPPEYAYLLARSEAFRAFCISNMSGSSGRQRVSTDCFKHFQVIIPSEKIIEIFSNTIKSIFEKIKEISESSKIMVDIRNVILPKLINGSIKVNGLDE